MESYFFCTCEEGWAERDVVHSLRTIIYAYDDHIIFNQDTISPEQTNFKFP